MLDLMVSVVNGGYIKDEVENSVDLRQSAKYEFLSRHSPSLTGKKVDMNKVLNASAFLRMHMVFASPRMDVYTPSGRYRITKEPVGVESMSAIDTMYFNFCSLVSNQPTETEIQGFVKQICELQDTGIL